MMAAGPGPRGFLLIQQMASLALSALLLLMLISAFVLQWQAFHHHSQLTQLHQTATQLQALFQREFSNARFWSALDPAAISAAGFSVNGDCHSPFDSGTFVQPGQGWFPLLAGQTGQAMTPFCLSSASKGSDFIQLKHLAGHWLQLHQLKSNRVYVQQTGQLGRAVLSGQAGLEPQAWFWPYIHEVYYVMPQLSAGQTIPVLMRKRVVRSASGELNMDTAAVLDGVELLVFEVGLDQNGDGVADVFRPAAQLSPPDWAQLRPVQLRYFALLRALKAEPGYQNAHLYRLGQRKFQAQSDPYRRLMIRSAIRL